MEEKDSNLRRQSRQISQSDPFGRSGTLHGYFPDFCLLGALEWWREKHSNLEGRAVRIYSLIPWRSGTPPKCGPHTTRSGKVVNPFGCD